MPDITYATIPDLEAATDAQVTDNMLIETAVPDSDSDSGYSSKKVTRGQLLAELKSDLADIEEQISGGGMGVSEALKVALLDIARHVYYDDDQGDERIAALEDALYPPANLVSIAAAYTQGGTVYDNQTLDSLKADLVVMARYDNGTTQTVTDYTLSGTLVTGTSTITVSYGGKTATFDVTVTHALAQYTITNTLTNCTNSNSATVINEETAYTGTLTADSGYIISAATITMGGTDITATAYNAETGAISIASVTGNIVITAEAVEDVGWISGVPYTLEFYDGAMVLNNSTGEVAESGNANDRTCVYMPCKGASAILAPVNYSGVFWYDEEKNFLYRKTANTAIDNPFHFDVPRNAAFFRLTARNANPPTDTTVPYKFPTLTENTAYQFDQYYALGYPEGTEAQSSASLKGFCHGASALQCPLFTRSFIQFYDAEKAALGSAVIRQNGTTAITVPEGAYYVTLNPGTVGGSGNTNNPWIKFSE